MDRGQMQQLKTKSIRNVHTNRGAPIRAKDLGVSNDYRTEQMPPVNSGLINGQLAWRQHDGGHTDAPNVKYFFQWADQHM